MSTRNQAVNRALRPSPAYYAAPGGHAVKRARRISTPYKHLRYASVPYGRRQYSGSYGYQRPRRPARAVNQAVPMADMLAQPQPAYTSAYTSAYRPRYRRSIPRRFAFQRVYAVASRNPYAYRTAVARHSRDWDTLRRRLGIKHCEDPMELPHWWHPADRYRARHELVPAFAEVLCEEFDKMQTPQAAVPVQALPTVQVQSLPVTAVASTAAPVTLV